VTARVLVVGAHPDDEDTRLLTYLARGRHAETAYLSLTRGDGGQNLIGNELGEALGAIRTEELLAARRLDGAGQYFTRAYDFGFSKSAEETFRHWPRDTVLGDVVRVVRAFRPHVVVAIFSGTRADGHGHHEASGILAREAYDAAADTARFPARDFGPAWSVPKLYRNTSYRGEETATLRYDAGRYDPVLGRSYAELAAISRTQHKSQGQGGAERKGPSAVSMRREATRVNAATPPQAERDLFDGVDTTWARLAPAVTAAPRRAALDSLPGALAAARLALDVRRPEAALPLLARAERLLQTGVCGGGGGPACAGGPSEAERDLQATRAQTMQRLHAAVQLAAGVLVEATAPTETPVAGRAAPVTVTVYNRGTRPVRVGALQVEGAGDASPDLLRGDGPTVVAPGASLTRTGPVVTPPPRGPWWLAAPRQGALFGVPGSATPEAWRYVGAYDVVVPLEVDGAFATAEAAVVRRTVDPVRGDVARPAAPVPAVSVTLDRAVEYARAGVPFDRVVRVRLHSADSASRPVTVRLALPAGLAPDSAARTVALGGPDAQATVAFRLRGTLRAGRHVIRAAAERGGERFATGYQLVDYEHVRPQRLYRPAEVAVEAVDVALPPRAALAYVPGVSDNVAPALADLGLPVTVLDSAALGTADLSRFTHVVVGPRAYEANAGLRAHNARLLDWTRDGGTMVVQYGQYEMTRPGVMPYPVTLGRPAQRVTLEDAPVTPAGDARVLATPNRLTAADWQGWVQERSTYMPATADPAYRTAISLNDPGEPANAHGILVAPLGRGTYVYVTLALFRQLPAGVPGAARLMANLLAARPAPAGAAAGPGR
jgi:LmbE family N-acetylglucosaminyl deacetylase